MEKVKQKKSWRFWQQPGDKWGFWLPKKHPGGFIRDGGTGTGAQTPAKAGTHCPREGHERNQQLQRRTHRVKSREREATINRMAERTERETSKCRINTNPSNIKTPLLPFAGLDFRSHLPNSMQKYFNVYRSYTHNICFEAPSL